MKQAVPVKWKHVNEGQATSCRYCPIALALSDFFSYVHVGAKWATIGVDPEAQEFGFDWKIREWIKAFDDGLAWAQPFIIVLDHKAKTAEMLTQ